jgi:hypothetical protein
MVGCKTGERQKERGWMARPKINTKHTISRSHTGGAHFLLASFSVLYDVLVVHTIERDWLI